MAYQDYRAGANFGERPTAVQPPPRLAARCYELRLVVPRTYEELEAAVERWIATCVQSRTVVRGAPAHREHELVRGNPTLRQVWERIRDAAGKMLSIRAEYVWGPNRVESIRFSAPVGVYNFEPEVVTAGPADTVDRIVKRALELLPDAAAQGVPLTPHKLSRIRCWLQMLRNPGTDDRFLTGQSMLEYKNFNGRQPPSYSNIRQWLLPAYSIQKRIVASDRAILQTLRSIDNNITDGKDWINQEFGTQQGAVHVTLQALRDWVDDRERDTKSIYNCYCIDSGKC
jgi:hypothetical protein